MVTLQALYRPRILLCRSQMIPATTERQKTTPSSREKTLTVSIWCWTQIQKPNPKVHDQGPVVSKVDLIRDINPF